MYGGDEEEEEEGSPAAAAAAAGGGGDGKEGGVFSKIEYSDQDAPPSIVHKPSISGASSAPRRSIIAPVAASPAAAGQGVDPGPLSPSGLNRSRSVNAATSIINAVSKPGVASGGGGGGDSEEEEDDEFFDCRENLDDTSSLAKWSSMELTPQVGGRHNINSQINNYSKLFFFKRTEKG